MTTINMECGASAPLSQRNPGANAFAVLALSTLLLAFSAPLHAQDQTMQMPTPQSEQHHDAQSHDEHV